MDDQSPLFTFESRDSLAQFLVVLLPLIGGGVVLAVFFDIAGFRGALVAALASGILALGLRSSISVTRDEVRVVKKWFFIPYWSYKAAEIQDVWYGGDWGDSEGAMGVVVKLGNKEVHIGTSKTMHQVHNALFRLSARYKDMNTGAASQSKPGT